MNVALIRTLGNDGTQQTNWLLLEEQKGWRKWTTAMKEVNNQHKGIKRWNVDQTIRTKEDALEQRNDHICDCPWGIKT